MFIKRVRVEEGFLHGLDLPLNRGLTVLIGARGSGKTSIIELIRFCLAAPSYSEAKAEIVERQALAVLGSGKVAVTLDVEGEDVVFTRSGAEDTPRRSSSMPIDLPIVLSQNEIEQIGRHADSRLRLLDEFVPSLRDNERSEDAARALISSLTVELHAVLSDVQRTEDELAKLASVPADLKEARTKALDASAHLEQAGAEKARLEEIGKLTASAVVRLQVYEEAQRSLSIWLRDVRGLAVGHSLEAWPAAAIIEDQLAPVREDLLAVDQSIQAAVDRLEQALEKVERLRADEQGQQIALEDEARTLRSFLDQLSEGTGLIMKRVSDLETLEQRAIALREHLSALRERGAGISAKREAELDRLDAIRETRINAREEAAAFLNSKLGPKIRITLNRFGSVGQYAETIADALRGSGLQYNVLAPELARSISPRELATAAETDDPQSIGDITGITLERAQRVAHHLRDVGTEGVLTAPLGDTVQLALLDGGNYKPAEDLSVGQRCTVVLPIILSHTERVLIVDQPEDNLDNSFVAETLVKALRNRLPTSQLVFATHNPNIPVLGEADRVVFLTSDGKRGDITHLGPLDDAESVRAITDVMEGGREAFAKRAAFYAQELVSDGSG